MHSYRIYDVVDGQQRLTTAVIFIQALADFFRTLPEHDGKMPSEIFVTETLSLANVEERYLFRTNPKGGFRTYKFGYTDDNPSQDYLRYRILGEGGGKDVQETFYTLNMGNAKTYFFEQIDQLHVHAGIAGLAELYKKLTKRLLFNEYVINEEFDVFVAFETMNNRGKKLSDLELLKNRIIYITTLYRNDCLDEAGRKSLRDDINGAWREVYYQLGRNKARPLNDDDFLRAHWISYFKYSRDTGRDYARFLLEEHFTPQRVHQVVERDVCLERVEEQRDETDVDDLDEESLPMSVPDQSLRTTGEKQLAVAEIRNFVASLCVSAGHWFNSFYPRLATTMSDDERMAIERLNRINMGYFRPLVMVILQTVPGESARLGIFMKIERFIFVAFRLGTARSNYRSSEFYNLARSLRREETTVEKIGERLDAALSYAFNKDGTLRADEFRNVLFKKFEQGSGYYGWSGLRYFLFEYEQDLLVHTRQQKVQWSDLLKSKNDLISIEHIYPQTPKGDWEDSFQDIPEKKREFYMGSLGNLLLLSMSINASLQNDAFAEKKHPKFEAGKKIRNGYSDGSHSEIEVARNNAWGPEEIRVRGLRLLAFMERRWNLSLTDDDREKLLFLDQSAR